MDDLLVDLQAKLSTFLAGCAILDPLQVLPMIQQLNPADIINECAKRFLLELSQHLVEMQNLDTDQLAEYVCMLAFKCDLSQEYASWILLPQGESASHLAIKTIRDIRLISITLYLLNKYKLYFEAVSLLIDWKQHGQIFASTYSRRNFSNF